MFTNMQIILNTAMPDLRTRGVFATGARRIPSEQFVHQDHNRLIAGAKFVPWGVDIAAQMAKHVACGPEEDLSTAIGTWPSDETQNAFSMAKGFECSTLSLGFEFDTIAERSEAFLEYVTGLVLTRELITGAASEGLSLQSSAVTPSGSTNLSISALLMAIDDWFDSVLGNGVGMIWVPTRALTRIVQTTSAGVSAAEPDVVRTPAGHIIVGDAGFGAAVTPAVGGTAATAPDTWVYASGPVGYGLNDIKPVGDGRQDTLDMTRNIRNVVARRDAILLFDPSTVAAFRLDL